MKPALSLRAILLLTALVCSAAAPASTEPATSASAAAQAAVAGTNPVILGEWARLAFSNPSSHDHDFVQGIAEIAQTMHMSNAAVIRVFARLGVNPMPVGQTRLWISDGLWSVGEARELLSLGNNQPGPIGREFAAALAAIDRGDFAGAQNTLVDSDSYPQDARASLDGVRAFLSLAQDDISGEAILFDQAANAASRSSPGLKAELLDYQAAALSRLNQVTGTRDALAGAVMARQHALSCWESDGSKMLVDHEQAMLNETMRVLVVQHGHVASRHLSC